MFAYFLLQVPSLMFLRQDHTVLYLPYLCPFILTFPSLHVFVSLVWISVTSLLSTWLAFRFNIYSLISDFFQFQCILQNIKALVCSWETQEVIFPSVKISHLAVLFRRNWHNVRLLSCFRCCLYMIYFSRALHYTFDFEEPMRYIVQFTGNCAFLFNCQVILSTHSHTHCNFKYFKAHIEVIMCRFLFNFVTEWSSLSQIYTELKSFVPLILKFPI